MTDAEKYPGLFEAFKEWHRSHCGNRLEWHDSWMTKDYQEFLLGLRSGCLFFPSKGRQELHKYPQYLLSIRDMSLV